MEFLCYTLKSFISYYALEHIHFFKIWTIVLKDLKVATHQLYVSSYEFFWQIELSIITALYLMPFIPNLYQHN